MPRTVVLYAALALAMFALIIGGHNAGPARAGTAPPNVAGKWEGTWSHRAGSGYITLQLAQEGTKVIGKQSLPGVIPVFGGWRRQYTLGTDVREGHLEDSTLIFYVRAPDAPGGRVNFTLTVSDETMTGTACGYTCATLKPKKAPFQGGLPPALLHGKLAEQRSGPSTDRCDTMGLERAWPQGAATGQHSLICITPP